MKRALCCLIAFLLVVPPGFAQQPQTPQSPKVSPGSPLVEEAGGKISLDIKGMDVVDVLKMLASRSGVNIVVGKNVAGRVTLFLKNVAVQDAFELVLLSNELAYEKKGDIINVMTQKDYETLYGERYSDKKDTRILQLKNAKASDVARSLTQIKTSIGKVVADEASNTIALIDVPDRIKEMEEFIKSSDSPIGTEVFGLNYASADKLQPKLQEVLTKGVGVLSVDERTNKIAVTDYPDKLDEIAKIISAFDERMPQVLIDAQIIEIKPSDKFEMGVDWDFWIKRHFDMRMALPAGTANRLFIGSPASDTVTNPGDHKAVIDLLQTIGDTKILSSPRITALNNQEARILVGTKDAYITSTTSQADTTAVTAQSVNFVDVGIKLYVTPTINRVGFVTMKLRPEISSAVRTDITSDGKITQIPIVTTSEAETSVMVKDGLTILIGGLKKDSRTKTVKKIPVVGDIPFLGALFRSTIDDLQTTELVILLTPHIVPADTSSNDFMEIKPKEGVAYKMEKGEISGEKFPRPPEEEIATAATLKEKKLEERKNQLEARKAAKAAAKAAAIAAKKEKKSKKKQVTQQEAPKPQLDDKKEEPVPSTQAAAAAATTSSDAAQGVLSYYRQVNDRIQQAAERSRPKDLKGKARLLFTINKDGSLEGEPQVVSSDNNELSPHLIAAVRSASPFEKFPEFMRKDRETFQISLDFE